MGGMGGNYGAMMAGQAVAQVATTAAAQSAQQEAMEALGGAARSNIKKGDQITLEYKLVKPGDGRRSSRNPASPRPRRMAKTWCHRSSSRRRRQVLTAISQLAAAQ